jgi:hypothetical protein
MRVELDRRKLFKVAAGIAAVGVPTELHAHRWLTSHHTLTEEKQRELRTTAQTLVQQGKIHVGRFSPIEVDTPQGKTTKQPVLHPVPIAEALLSIAYMDGGEENANKMAGLLQSHNGIAIEEADLFSSQGRTHDVQYLTSNEADKQLLISIDPLGFNVNENGFDTFAHEFYHVNQIARGNHRIIKNIGVGIFAFICFSILTATVKNTNLYKKREAEDLTRREFMEDLGKIGLRTLAATALGYWYYINYTPHEREAIVQTDQSIGTMTNQEPIQSLLQRIVTFEDIK